ncbi:MAG: TonB-dependent receptor [Bacteroidales bacterium]|nr:TonB-dependent receptor [Bacteroidales bacterium]
MKHLLTDGLTRRFSHENDYFKKRDMARRFCFVLLMAFLPLATIAQYSLSGTIKNAESGESLPGANILLKGTYIATVSGTDGTYSFNRLKKGNYSIRITFVGFKTIEQDLLVDGQLRLDFKMDPVALLTDEIIVTATRAQSKSPLAFTEVGAEQINRENTGKDLPYLLASSPSTVVTSDGGAGMGYTGIRIRGTDLTRINVTLNGVPVNDPESQNVFFVDLPDLASSVDNIQVQRGVGTSSNGAASFGASINIKTDPFRPDLYTELSSTAGSFNTFKNTLKFGSGLINGKFSIDGRISILNSSGYVDRASAALRSVQLSAAYYGKKDIVKLLYIHGTEKTYQAWYGNPKDSLADNPTYNPAGEIYDAEGNFLGFYDNQTDNYGQTYYQLHYAHEFTKKLNLVGTLFYTKGRGYYENYKNNKKFAAYGMNDTIIGGDTITRTSLIEQRWLDNDFYGINLFLNYQAGRVELNFGSGWNQYLGDHFGKIIWAQIARLGDYERNWYFGTGNKTEFNIFTRANFQVNDYLSLYADMQFRTISYKIAGTDDDLRDVSQQHDYNFFNPKAGIFYEMNKSNKLYFSVAVAHREPNRSVFLDADPGQLVKPERLIDYELGYRFRTSHLSLETNLFYMDYKDQLVLTGKINNVGAAILTNVPVSYRAGIEVVAGFNFLKVIDWSLNATFSENKIKGFTEYVDNWNYWEDPDNQPYQYETYLGKSDISFSPAWVAGSNFRVTAFKGFSVSLVSNYVGRQYIDNTSSRERSLDPYFVNNIRFFYVIQSKWMRQMEFLLGLNNIFDEKYETNAWVYRYVWGEEESEINGYFPQAGFHFTVGLNLKF